MPGFDDQKEADLAGLGAENPLPHLQSGGGSGFLLDKEIIHNRLYGAINFFYELSATHVIATGEWTIPSGVADRCRGAPSPAA